MKTILNLNPKELYSYIKSNILYGFIDKNNNKYYPNDFSNIDIDSLYILQSPEQVLTSKCAWCWDVVELYRSYMENNNIPYQTYYMEYFNPITDIHQTHSFILYNINDKWYNIEDNSSNNADGIFEYNSKLEAENTIINSFQSYIKDAFNITDFENKFEIYTYAKPSYGIGSIEFQNWCKNGIRREY